LARKRIVTAQSTASDPIRTFAVIDYDLPVELCRAYDGVVGSLRCAEGERKMIGRYLGRRTTRLFVRLFFVSLSLSSCAQTTWQTDKYVSPEYKTEIKKIYVSLAISSEFFAPNRNLVRQSLSEQFSACHIESMYSFGEVAYESNPLTFMFENGTLIGTSSEGKEAFQPDVDLVVQETKKAPWSTLLTPGTNRSDIGRYYEATLIDAKSKSVVWKTTLYVTGNNGVTALSSNERGRSFGRDIVSFMSSNGIIKTCR
jgi:hypothetical protein